MPRKIQTQAKKWRVIKRMEKVRHIILKFRMLMMCSIKRREITLATVVICSMMRGIYVIRTIFVRYSRLNHHYFCSVRGVQPADKNPISAIKTGTTDMKSAKK